MNDRTRTLRPQTQTIDLAALGWDSDFQAAFRRYRCPGQRPGRVARIDKGIATVLTDTGAQRASLAGRMLATVARNPRTLPCTGDWVVVRTWPDDRVTIEATLPRRTAVVRTGADRSTRAQILAANVDAVAVVEAVDPEPDLGRIERLLALATDSGARPLILLTKADTVAPGVLRSLCDEVAYTAPDVPVYAVSAHTGDGLNELAPYLERGRTLGLLGASGVGKSTLVNTLAGATVMATRALRADQRGRHTTTYRALVPLPSGGVILDTPGLRQIGMYDSSEGLRQVFADLEALAQRCRFTDCRHESEPECAVQEALATGELEPRRLTNWRKLRRELLWEKNRRRARMTAAERAEARRVERVANPRYQRR